MFYDVLDYILLFSAVHTDYVTVMYFVFKFCTAMNYQKKSTSDRDPP